MALHKTDSVSGEGTMNILIVARTGSRGLIQFLEWLKDHGHRVTVLSTETTKGFQPDVVLLYKPADPLAVEATLRGRVYYLTDDKPTRDQKGLVRILGLLGVSARPTQLREFPSLISKISFLLQGRD